MALLKKQWMEGYVFVFRKIVIFIQRHRESHVFFIHKAKIRYIVNKIDKDRQIWLQVKKLFQIRIQSKIVVL